MCGLIEVWLKMVLNRFRYCGPMSRMLEVADSPVLSTTAVFSGMERTGYFDMAISLCSWSSAYFSPSGKGNSLNASVGKQVQQMTISPLDT